MLINATQDMFYSTTLSADTQEYVEIPVPAGAAGIKILVGGGAGTLLTGFDTDATILASGWESLFETFRLEDNTRSESKVIDLNYNSSATVNDMAHLTELALLAAPIPGEQMHTVSDRHINLWTGPLGECRLFIKMRSSIAAAFASGSGTAITLHFVALMAPAIAPQTWKQYHIGQSTDTNVEFRYPSGVVSRSVITTGSDYDLDDIYIDGKHSTSNPITMAIDYNILRGHEAQGGNVYNRYFWGANLGGQKVRFEKTATGAVHFSCIYQG
uniref:Uncharacterized protein n=1 Tax=viral metagenome TaxID=1070528 RepID=A0A2V0R9S9_9ZZZZ